MLKLALVNTSLFPPTVQAASPCSKGLSGPTAKKDFVLEVPETANVATGSVFLARIHHVLNALPRFAAAIWAEYLQSVQPQASYSEVGLKSVKSRRGNE